MKTINPLLSHSFQRAFRVTSASLALLGLTVAPAVLGTSTVQAAPANDVELNTFIGDSAFKQGETIPVSLRATNTTGHKVTLQFSSGQRYDFKVYREGEPNPVYTWSAGILFIKQPGTVEIKAGLMQLFTAKLPTDQLQSGKYRLEAMLTSNPLVVASPVNFEIGGKLSAKPAKDLQFMAKTDKKNYVMGEAVKVDFALFNPNGTPATVNFKTGQQYDIVVRNSDGDDIWSWAANKKFLMVSLPLTLQANETKNYSEVWNQEVLFGKKLKPGKYTVHVFFESQPRLKADPITIKIQ